MTDGDQKMTEVAAPHMAGNQHISVHDPNHPIGGNRRRRVPPLAAFQSMPADADETDSMGEAGDYEEKMMQRVEVKIDYASK